MSPDERLVKARVEALARVQQCSHADYGGSVCRGCLTTILQQKQEEIDGLKEIIREVDCDQCRRGPWYNLKEEPRPL